jgi:hypothetical protein
MSNGIQLFFKIPFLLAYISCTGEFQCDIYIHAYNVSSLDSLLTFSLILPPPHFLEQLQQVSLLYFQTYIQSTSTIFVLLYPIHLLSALYM